MSSLLLTAPAIEPLSLAEAKAFLRVETGDDDDVIGALIAGARIHVEAQTRRALITQSWRLAFDAWPDDGRLTVLPAPLQALSTARVYDFDNGAHALDTGAFVLDKGASTLIFAPWALPAPGRLAAGIELDVTVGYGDAAVDVPQALRQAIRLLVAHWYENRGLVTAGTATVLPSTVAARHLVAIEREAFRAGDVLLFRWRTNLPAKHAAIVTASDKIVHAHDGAPVAEVAIAPW